MNLLARILSHGFALLVVVLIGVTLMYRGDLFPEWPMPEFLVIENGSNAGTDAVAPVPLDTATASAESSVTGPAEAPAGVDAAIVTQDTVAPVDEADADVDTATTEPGPVTAVVDNEATPEEPVVDMADSSPGTVTETGITDTGTAGEPDEATVAVPLDNEVPEQTEIAPVTPPALNTTSGTATEQAESVPAAPPAIDTTSEDLTEPVETAPAALPAIDTTSQGLTEPAEATPAAPPAINTTSEDQTEPVETAPAVPPASDSSSETATEQAESVAPAIAPASNMTHEAVAESPESPVQEVETSMPAADETVTAEPEPVPEPVVAQMPVAPAGDSDGKRAYELLAAAREAYWLHDFEMAETHYRQLIQMEPDNPDGYGELGNMYFAQGQWEQAAAAYFEAGVRLLESGMIEEARQMVDVIRGLNGAQADDLEERINAAS